MIWEQRDGNDVRKSEHSRIGGYSVLLDEILAVKLLECKNKKPPPMRHRWLNTDEADDLRKLSVVDEWFPPSLPFPPHRRVVNFGLCT
jgi:hypothetical protein